MKLYSERIEECSGYKSIGVLETKSNRALFGLYYGYFSIFWRVFNTNFQLVDMGAMNHFLNTCNKDELALSDFQNILNEPLTPFEYLKYRIKLPIIKLYSTIKFIFYRHTGLDLKIIKSYKRKYHTNFNQARLRTKEFYNKEE
jgi:hypothetical protein